MKKKSMNLITAVAVLVVLSGAYVGVKTYVAKQEEKENAEEEEEKTQVFSISSEDVQSIKFVIDKKEVTFEKNNDEWVKSDERDFPVLIEAIGSLNNVEADRVLDNITDTTEYGLDDPTNTITITDKDGKETVLHVGMENASTSQYYVENGEDESKIYVVADSVFQPFMKTLYDYAKAGTFPVIDSSTISNVTVDENSYTLTKDDNTGLWNIQDQDGAEKADSAKVSSLTSSIASIAYGSFVNYNCKDLSEYGLDKPYGTITIDYQEEVEEKSDSSEDGDASEENSTDEQDTTEDKDDASAVDSTEEDTSATDSSDTQTRMVNREMTILVGDQSDDDGRYVMVNNSKEIYTISNDTLSVFLGKTKEDFWDMTVSYLSVNNLESLQAEYQGETHVIDVSRETSEDNSGDDSSTTSTTTLSYQLDGTELDDSTPFTTFYNKLINMTGQKRLTEKYENNNKSDFDVELEDVDGEKTKIDYYQYDTNFYAAVVGQKVYLVNKMTVKELIDSYKTLVGQTDSESSDENSDLVSEENATDEESNSADNTDNTNGVDVD